MFDHVAHLAGAAFGFVYYSIGKDVWTWIRIQLGAKERRVRLD
jgi:rhomboid-like protein